MANINKAKLNTSTVPETPVEMLSRGPRRGSFPDAPMIWQPPNPPRPAAMYPRLPTYNEILGNIDLTDNIDNIDVDEPNWLRESWNFGRLSASDYLLGEVDLATDSDPDFQHSVPAPLRKPSTSTTQNRLVYPTTLIDRAAQMAATPENVTMTTDDSFIEVALLPNPPTLTPTTTSADNASIDQLIRQNVLPDGTLTAKSKGQGLGRGRPGIKRGPRKSSTLAGSPIDASGTLDTISQASENRILTPTTNKRKRAESDALSTRPRSASSLHSHESTPEYNPTASQTRSGRQTQKPTPIVVPSSTTASPVTKRQNSTIQSASTPLLKSHPKIKRRIYRGKEQSALCEHCTRGHGPSGNVIVFCDACNKCWHQRCHSPQISPEVVSDTNADWFCATCDKILHGKKGKKLSVSTSKPQPQPQPATPAPAAIESPTPQAPHPPAQHAVQEFGLPMLGAQRMSINARMTYLNSLTKEQLIEVVNLAATLAPQMPIFKTALPLALPPPPPGQPALPPHITLSRTTTFQPQFSSNYVTPVTELPPGFLPSGVSVGAETLDEGYDDHFDEHALLYPKAGEGVPLPPDSVDIHILLEGPESRTFSHWVRGQEMKYKLDNVTLV